MKDRIPLNEGLRAKGKKVKSKDKETIRLGYEEIDLDYVEQTVDKSQTNAIAEIIRYREKYIDERKSLKEILKAVFKDINKKGLKILSPFYRKAPIKFY